jgi:hypothetical protein
MAEKKDETKKGYRPFLEGGSPFLKDLKKAYDTRNLLQGEFCIDDKDKADQTLYEELAKIIKEFKDIPALVKEFESIQAANGGKDGEGFAFPLFYSVFDVAATLKDGPKFQELLCVSKADLCNILQFHIKDIWAVKHILEIKEYTWCKTDFDHLLFRARYASQEVKDMLTAAQAKCVVKTGKFINLYRGRWNLLPEEL